MSIAAANCWFSALYSSSCATSAHSLSSHRLFCASRKPFSISASKCSDDLNQNPVRGKTKNSPREPAIQNAAIIKKFPPRSRHESPSSNADERSTRNKTGRFQSTAFKSFGVQRKGNKGLVVDSKEQQVETGNLQDAAFLNAVVKVYCTHTAPDYSLPWQKQRQYTSTGSAFMIGEGKLLTNAHCVEHDTQVKVKRRGDDTKYVAKVLARGVECDIALLSVESKEFWEGAEPLHLGKLPNLQQLDRAQ